MGFGFCGLLIGSSGAMAIPIVFVGSSSEGLDIAQAIRNQLQDVAQVSIWNEGVFGLSRGTLESLVSALEDFDFAVLVITADDLVISRGSESQAPRDNIMFELGLFMGGLGPDRTFGVCRDDGKIKLPSDLAGVTLASYDVRAAKQDPASGLGPAVMLIRQAIREHGCMPRGTRTPEEKLADTYSRIEVSVDELAGEILHVYRMSLPDWRTIARVYIEQCLRYQKAAMEELNDAVCVHRHLRKSVDEVRELIASGITETISILDKTPRSSAKFKEQFNRAAKVLRGTAQRISEHAHRLVTECQITEARRSWTKGT
jgi:hypothetical protein